ncbi:MAG: PKD domain-containing protein [Actinobacteria bacterium]|nr:MAG: PKD domain-containing protein [Actinomycetota bacterium]
MINPLLNGWYQTASGNEEGDGCRWNFGPLPEPPPSEDTHTHAANFANQLINGHPYYLQWAFNGSEETIHRGLICWGGVALEPRFTAPNPVNVGDVVGFDSTESFFTFDANPTGLPLDEPYARPTYQWAFGDGTTAEGNASVFHSYQYGGKYTATLTLTDGGANVALATREVLVNGPPAPSAPGKETTPGGGGGGGGAATGGSATGGSPSRRASGCHRRRLHSETSQRHAQRPRRPLLGQRTGGRPARSASGTLDRQAPGHRRPRGRGPAARLRSGHRDRPIGDRHDPSRTQRAAAAVLKEHGVSPGQSAPRDAAFETRRPRRPQRRPDDGAEHRDAGHLSTLSARAAALASPACPVAEDEVPQPGDQQVADDDRDRRDHGDPRAFAAGRFAAEGYRQRQDQRDEHAARPSVRGAHLPAGRVGAAAPGGVVHDAVHVHVGVAGRGVDRDVAAGPRRAPGLEFAGGLGRAQQAPGGERVAHRARAVVGVVDERGVTASEDVREVGDRVRAGDHLLHHFGNSRGDRERAVAADRPPPRDRGEPPLLGLLGAAFHRLHLRELLADFSVRWRPCRHDRFAGLRRRLGRGVMHGARDREAAGFLRIGDLLGDATSAGARAGGHGRRATRRARLGRGRG